MSKPLSLSPVECQQCHRVLAHQQSYRRHIKICNLYLQHQAQQEINRISSELQESKTQTQELINKIQNLPTTVIHNTTVNYNNYYNLHNNNTLRSLIAASCKEKFLQIIISAPANISSFWFVQHLLPKISEYVTAHKNPDDNRLVFSVKHSEPHVWTEQQFLDFVKESICDIGLFTEQFLFLAEAACTSKDFNLLKEKPEQVKSNFDNFCTWMQYDRSKQTNVEFIEKYEMHLLSMIYANC
jgi:hypothetical protein